MPKSIEDEPSYLAFSRVMAREGQSVPASLVQQLIDRIDGLEATR